MLAPLSSQPSVERFAVASPPATPAVKLTRREQQILLYLMRGYSIKETAVALGVSRHTVKQHSKTLYHKIAVVNRVGAVLWAMQQESLRLAAETIPLVAGIPAAAP